MYTCYIQSFKILASFCSCAGWFESYLAKHSLEDTFSRDVAHIRLKCRVLKSFDKLPGDCRTTAWSKKKKKNAIWLHLANCLKASVKTKLMHYWFKSITQHSMSEAVYFEFKNTSLYIFFNVLCCGHIINCLYLWYFTNFNVQLWCHRWTHEY